MCFFKTKGFFTVHCFTGLTVHVEYLVNQYRGIIFLSVGHLLSDLCKTGLRNVLFYAERRRELFLR
jgi:hypothetical protein